MGREKLLEQLSPPSMRLAGPRRGIVDADVLLVGHSHIPFRLELNGLTLANPGSVGQPRDGDPRASYAILDTDNGRVEHYRVKYDVGRVLGKLERLGLEDWCFRWLRAVLLQGRAVDYTAVG